MKRWLLFILLLFPALFYIFLQKFGENEYDVPVFYEQGVENSECIPSGTKPYLIPDSLIDETFTSHKMLVVVTDSSQVVKDEIDNIKSKMVNRMCRYIFIHENESSRLICLLAMPENTNAVLIDRQRRIRGYYTLGKNKEQNRLMDEVGILFTRKK